MNRNFMFLISVLANLIVIADPPAAAQDNTPPRGFKALFNGRNLQGWQGW